MEWVSEWMAVINVLFFSWSIVFFSRGLFVCECQSWSVLLIFFRLSMVCLTWLASSSSTCQALFVMELERAKRVKAVLLLSIGLLCQMVCNGSICVFSRSSFLSLVFKTAGDFFRIAGEVGLARGNWRETDVLWHDRLHGQDNIAFLTHSNKLTFKVRLK